MLEVVGFDVYLYSTTRPIRVNAEQYTKVGEFVQFDSPTDLTNDPPRAEFRLTSVFAIVAVCKEPEEVVDKYFFYDNGYGPVMSDSFATDEIRIDALRKTIREEGLDSGDDVYLLDIVNGFPEVMTIVVADYISEEGDDNEQTT